MSFSRSLRDADPRRTKYHLVGSDCDQFNIHRAECDKTYLCPKANDPAFIPYIKELIKKESIDLIHTQPEIEAYMIGRHREEVLDTGCRIFMPPQEVIELLRDKGRSYHLWKNAGIKVPENIELNSEADLRKAFDRFGEDIWIRETIGAAGKGALSRPSYEMALHQLNEANSWGHAVAAEHLTTETVTWQSIWHKGELIVAQGRKRLYWAFGNRAQSGVTGLTGTGVTYSDVGLDNLAKQCVKAAADKPHGIFSVDFTYDKQGMPNPTEINIGKFFTTHHFITRAGCNMPDIFVQLAFGEYKGSYGVLNPCPEEMYWIRGIDVEPVLLLKSEIDNKVDELKEILSNIS